MITKLHNRVVITETSEFGEAQRIQREERAAGKRLFSIQYRGEAKRVIDQERMLDEMIDWPSTFNALSAIRAKL